MLQETNSQARTLARTLDNSRNIGDDYILLTVRTQDAKVRNFCSERIRRNFWTCIRKSIEQRRFTCIREAHQTDIRHNAQFKEQFSVFARLTFVRRSWSLICRRFEVDVSPAAVSAFKENKLLVFALGGEFFDKFFCFGITDCCSGRNCDNNILAVLAVFIPAHAVAAVLSLKKTLETDICESLYISLYTEYDISALAAVTAVRAAHRDILFTAERHTAVPALA